MVRNSLDLDDAQFGINTDAVVRALSAQLDPTRPYNEGVSRTKLTLAEILAKKREQLPDVIIQSIQASVGPLGEAFPIEFTSSILWSVPTILKFEPQPAELSVLNTAPRITSFTVDSMAGSLEYRSQGFLIDEKAMETADGVQHFNMMMRQFLSNFYLTLAEQLRKDFLTQPDYWFAPELRFANNALHNMRIEDVIARKTQQTLAVTKYRNGILMLIDQAENVMQREGAENLPTVIFTTRETRRTLATHNRDRLLQLTEGPAAITNRRGDVTQIKSRNRSYTIAASPVTPNDEARRYNTEAPLMGELVTGGYCRFRNADLDRPDCVTNGYKNWKLIDGLLGCPWFVGRETETNATPRDSKDRIKGELDFRELAEMGRILHEGVAGNVYKDKNTRTDYTSCPWMVDVFLRHIPEDIREAGSDHFVPVYFLGEIDERHLSNETLLDIAKEIVVFCGDGADFKDRVRSIYDYGDMIEHDKQPVGSLKSGERGVRFTSELRGKSGVGGDVDPEKESGGEDEGEVEEEKKKKPEDTVHEYALDSKEDKKEEIDPEKTGSDTIESIETADFSNERSEEPTHGKKETDAYSKALLAVEAAEQELSAAQNPKKGKTPQKEIERLQEKYKLSVVKLEEAGREKDAADVRELDLARAKKSLSSSSSSSSSSSKPKTPGKKVSSSSFFSYSDPKVVSTFPEKVGFSIEDIKKTLLLSGKSYRETQLDQVSSRKRLFEGRLLFQSKISDAKLFFVFDWLLSAPVNLDFFVALASRGFSLPVLGMLLEDSQTIMTESMVFLAPNTGKQFILEKGLRQRINYYPTQRVYKVEGEFYSGVAITRPEGVYVTPHAVGRDYVGGWGNRYINQDETGKFISRFTREWKETVLPRVSSGEKQGAYSVMFVPQPASAVRTTESPVIFSSGYPKEQDFRRDMPIANDARFTVAYQRGPSYIGQSYLNRIFGIYKKNTVLAPIEKISVTRHQHACRVNNICLEMPTRYKSDYTGTVVQCPSRHMLGDFGEGVRDFVSTRIALNRGLTQDSAYNRPGHGQNFPH